MDGYTFCLGLEGLNLLDRADASVQGLVLPVIFLIRDAIFRPQIMIKPSSHFSLQIRPLAELVDLYHCRKATDPRDKIFALLGMSTGNPGAAGIVPDYEASWEDVIRKLVQFSLSHETAVTAWDTREAAVVRANGCVLGRISSTQTLHIRGGRQTMEVTWTNPAIPLNKGALQRTLWTFYTTAKLAKEGDIVCLVKNSKHLSIVRAHEDYSSIIISKVPVSDRVLPWLPSITAFPTQFLLVWDWGSESDSEVPRSFRQYQSVLGTAAPGKELQACIGKANRLLDVAAMLRVAALFEEEAHRILTASNICEEGFATWGNEIMTEGLCDLLLRDEGDWTPLYGLAQQGHFGIIEWFIRAGKIKQEQHGTMLLWYAEQTKQSTVARLLFDAGAFSVQEQLSRAVDEWERAGDEDTFRVGVFEQFRVLSQLGSNTRRQSMVKFLLDTGIVSLEEAFWWAAENKRFTPFGAMLRNFDQYSMKYAPTWYVVLMQAAQKGDKFVVEALLVEKDIYSGITLNDILPAIEHAAEAGQKKLVSVLIGTQRPDAVFIEAAKVGFEAAIRAMLEEYPPCLWNVSVRLSLVSIGYNALSVAVEHGQERIARLLLEHRKSGINMRDPRGRTALHLAILRRQRAMVELLVASGKADVKARDIEGKTPVQLAAECGDEEIYKLVLRRK